jgi:hypothetical protein
MSRGCSSRRVTDAASQPKARAKAPNGLSSDLTGAKSGGSEVLPMNQAGAGTLTRSSGYSVLTLMFLLNDISVNRECAPKGI